MGYVPSRPSDTELTHTASGPPEVGGKTSLSQKLAPLTPLGVAAVAGVAKWLSSHRAPHHEAETGDPILRGIARGIDRARSAEITHGRDVERLSGQAKNFSSSVVADAAAAGRTLTPAQSELLAEWATVAFIAGASPSRLGDLVDELCPFLPDE